MKRFKPKGIIIKRLTGTYYAYYATSKRLPDKKYPVQIIKVLAGRIDESGFHKLSKAFVETEHIVIRECGFTNFLLKFEEEYSSSVTMGSRMFESKLTAVQKELLNIEGIPSHDTFSRVLRFTNFEKLSSSLGEWMKGSFPDIYEKYQDKKVLHIDGKTVRAADEKANGEKPIYHLNAMYEGESIGVEIKRVGEKENEISCLPDTGFIYEKLGLESFYVTIARIGIMDKTTAVMKDGQEKMML